MQIISELLVIVFTVLLSGSIVAFMLPHIVLLSLKKKLLDPFSERKIHTKRTSRLGGISFFVGIFISFLLALPISNTFGVLQINITNTFACEICAVFILYIVGLSDDLSSVKYRKKFIFQILTAILIIISGTYIRSLNGLFGVFVIPEYIGIPLTILLIVFITNALNLIDGLDGLASSLSIMALTVYGVLFFMCDKSIDMLIAFATVGALIPFLYANLKRVKKRTTTKIIMGDSGALVIGLILSIMMVKLWGIEPNESYIIHSTYFHVMAFTMILVPCLDVLRVILHRAKNKKPLFLPDKNHFHHKLIALGCTHHQSLVRILFLNTFFILLNIILISNLPVICIIVLDILIWTVVHILITGKINNNNMIRHISLLILMVVMLSSCATQHKILYLQDRVVNTEIETIKGGEIRLKSNDAISIFVSSKNPELASVFNLPRVQQSIGNSSSNSASSGENGVLGYIVDLKGYIDFPVLGKLQVEGLTKLELTEVIKHKILNSDMIKDPIVTVEFSNLTFSTMGEVVKPGSYNITKDKITILEALSMSGDLTINGVRDKVFITRKLDDKVITYQLDLKSTSIYQSPAYYVQQNDMIYVEPNKTRSNQSTVNGNTVRSASFWMSLTSLLTTLTLIFVN